MSYNARQYVTCSELTLSPITTPPDHTPQAEMLAHAAARFRSQAAAFSNMGGGSSPNDRGKSLPSDEEVSETNQRNKAISSSAITRAMADGQAGERQLTVTCDCVHGNWGRYMYMPKWLKQKALGKRLFFIYQTHDT